MFLIRVRTAWDDYFPGSSPSQTFVPKEYTTVQPTSSTNVFVLNCLFIGCTSTSSGGALSCSSSVQRLLVESSSFFSCSISSGQGGAIYFENTNSGECALYKVCGNDCSTSGSYDLFLCAYVQDSVSKKNCVNYSSISRCVSPNTNTGITLRIDYGKIYCQSINSSMNRCDRYTGIYFNSYPDSNYATCFLSYSSFADNIANRYCCINQGRTAVRAEMKCCNVLRNTQGSLDSYAVIRFNGNTIVTDSCILMNNATYTFCTYSSSKITVSNCTIDSTSHQNNVVFTNSVTKSFINALNHFSTKNCDAEYDSAGILTALLSSKKNAIYYTCNCHSRISDLFSLTYLFMVTFIHFEPSS
jgi:hypothetical protein